NDRQCQMVPRQPARRGLFPVAIVPLASNLLVDITDDVRAPIILDSERSTVRENLFEDASVRIDQGFDMENLIHAEATDDTFNAERADVCVVHSDTHSCCDLLHTAVLNGEEPADEF